MQNDFTSVRHCWTSFQKNNCILLDKNLSLWKKLLNGAPEALGCATELANRVCLWSRLLVGSEPPNPSAALLVFLSNSCSECLVILAGAGAGAVWDPALNEKCLKGFLLLGVGCGVLITSPILCCKWKKINCSNLKTLMQSTPGLAYNWVFLNCQNESCLWRVGFFG